MSGLTDPYSTSASKSAASPWSSNSSCALIDNHPVHPNCTSASSCSARLSLHPYSRPHLLGHILQMPGDGPSQMQIPKGLQIFCIVLLISTGIISTHQKSRTRWQHQVVTMSLMCTLSQSLDSHLSLVVKAESSRSVYVSYELHFSLSGCLLKTQSVTAWLIPGSVPVSSSLYPDVVYQDSLLQNLTLKSRS